MTQAINKFRRQILVTLASLPITGWASSARSAFDHDYLLAKSLTSILNNRSSAKFIGKIYLETTPDEANLKHLLNRIFHDHPELKILAVKNNLSLAAQVNKSQCDDFEKKTRNMFTRLAFITFRSTSLRINYFYIITVTIKI